MSETEGKSKHSIEISDVGPSQHVATQYGMRYPNGAVRWTKTVVHGGQTIVFGGLREECQRYHDVEYWNRDLKVRAADAMVDEGEYRAAHQLIKRTVIVVTTEAEEV